MSASRPDADCGAILLVVMGVAGAGKSTLARALANSLQWELLEADDFHSAANVEKMRKGVALDDRDREPWTAALLSRLAQLEASPCILACSALTGAVQASLSRSSRSLHWAWLEISETEAVRRIRARQDHFMPASLVPSQFASLSVPEGAIRLDATAPTAELESRVFDYLVQQRLI